jgi:hypothetical protein
MSHNFARRLWQSPAQVTFCLLMVLSAGLTIAFFDGTQLAMYGPRVLRPSGQRPIQIGGSFMVAVVCKDGILVAADSRGTVEDDGHRRLAYYDGVQKVFPLGTNALAYTGTDFIQNLHFSALVREFSKMSPTGVDQIIPAFLQFSDQLPEVARLQFRKQSLVVAGYINGAPSICYYNEAQNIGSKYACGFGLVSSDRTTLDEYGTQLATTTSAEAAPLVEKAIKSYSRQHNEITIGGPIYIRLLTSSGQRWLSDAPQESSWTYLHDFAADYWKGKITLTLLPGINKSELDEVVRKGEVWSRQGSQR